MENNYKNLNDIHLLSIEEINTHNELNCFYVASYQRGYRWGDEEVEYLLNDINDIDTDKKYCIQPLTIQKKDGTTWELIDGQQRTTTIFLILTVFKNCFSLQSNYYRLDYNTRSSTKQFLFDIREKDILNKYLQYDFELAWKKYVNENSENDNIDNYHIFKVYFIIHRWLFIKTSEERESFINKLKFQTYVIWHPIIIKDESTQTVEDFFINMNAGKIKLTSAELIKALFIINIEKSDDPWDVRDFKKKKLASEWDTIENDLHNNTFWFFINNNEKQEYPTRIGKLFDIHCEKLSKDKTGVELFSYYQYNKGKSKGGENLDWEKIKQIYQRLKEWYEDIEIYHLVGFIINANFMTLDNIIKDTENKTKLEIKDFLKNTIKDKFAASKNLENNNCKYSLDNLRYNSSYNECSNVLLLYNIKLIEKTFPNQRFPFDLFQNEETKWSIEHIHPQNPRKIKDKEEALEWLNDFKERLKEESLESDKIANLENLFKEVENSTSLTNEIATRIKEFSDSVDESLGLHQIDNLALLDKYTNSKIGNKSFLKKRNIILNESEKSYIPLGTINVFLKKTTKTNEENTIKLKFWSSQDAEDYKNDIEQLLIEFLPKQL